MSKSDSSAQSVLHVAIQGFEGSFHDMAARKFFPGQQLAVCPCENFRDAFEQVRMGDALAAVVAIENSLAGSLLPNYALLRNSGLKICGEVFLRIEQNLMALPGQQLADIVEVQSHPMAIIQCEEFLDPLRKKGVRIVDTVDTALSARNIFENQWKGIAALASSRAADLYNLEILAAGIETNKRNFTRFLVLLPAENHDFDCGDKADKASVCFSLPHKVGSLSQVLSVLAYYRINLTKIQSAPIVGKEWEYIFYIDLVFDSLQRLHQALAAIEPLTEQLQVLGTYAEGRI